MDVPAKRSPPTGPLPLPVQKDRPDVVASARSDSDEAAHYNPHPAKSRPTRPASPDPSPSLPETLAPYALLMGDTADKTKVSSLRGAAGLVARLGPEVAEASYLVPHSEPGRVFRLGKTVANGGFSKIRDYVDQDGNVGKMRVLHLQPQRAPAPKRPMHVTVPGAHLDERDAMEKAGSPLASERTYSVVTGSGHDARVKLYTPVPDLGIDSFYIAYNDVTKAADPRPAAAAIRSYVRAVNDTLLRLHPDDAHGPGMAHRDIKLENVLFDAAGKVTLIDFGGAASLREIQQSRGADGTIGYFAPEYLARMVPRANGSLWPLTAKLDVWSLAVTTLLTFYSDNGFRLAQQTLPNDGNRRPVENINLALLQEAWQRAREGRTLTDAQNQEIHRTFPAHASSSVRAQVARAVGDVLDSLKKDVDRVDPAMGKWFFQRFYRADPNERFDSKQLAQALDLLPPLYDSHATDRAVARDVFATLYPLAAANVQASLAEVDDGQPGPTLEQLRALPARPEG